MRGIPNPERYRKSLAMPELRAGHDQIMTVLYMSPGITNPADGPLLSAVVEAAPCMAAKHK